MKVYILSLALATWQKLNKFEESFDVNISMEIEPLPNNVEAMYMAFDIAFEAGDIVKKLIAFIAQLYAYSDNM